MYPYLDINKIDPATRNKYENLGYWLVDGHKMFRNKNQALLDCTKNNSYDIKYCLADPVFNHMDWQREPDLPLESLYKMRAQQIRDTYDHVVLTYSGGSDSTNILYSFIENKIYPDEVVSFMCIGKDFSETNTNFNKEITFNKDNIKRYVLDNGIPFNTLDVSNFYNHMFNDPDWCFHMGHNRAYISARSYASDIKKYNDLVGSGKKCCIVYGLEKPNLAVDDSGGVYTYFIDFPLQQYTNDKMYEQFYYGLTPERFYVSGDMPELTIKQTHVMASYYQHKNEDKITKIGFPYNDTGYKEDCMDVLYGHSFDRHKCFTIGKTPYITGYRDDWLYSLPKHDSRKKNVVNGLLYLKDHIAKHWFNGNQWIYDTVGCISKKFYLGKTFKKNQ